jgi:hypothetical protein
MRHVESAGHLHPESHHLVERQGTQLAEPRLQRTLPVVLHHQERVTARGFTDLQHAHNVRVAGEPTHGALLTQEPVALIVEFGRQYLHRHQAVQRELGASVDDPETATPHLFGVGESGRAQLRDDGIADVALGPDRVFVHHRLPAMSLSIAPEQTTR